jgi:hypothetical protein
LHEHAATDGSDSHEALGDKEETVIVKADEKRVPMVEVQNEVEGIADVGRAYQKRRGRPKKDLSLKAQVAEAAEPLDPGKGSVPDSSPGSCLDPVS